MRMLCPLLLLGLLVGMAAAEDRGYDARLKDDAFGYQAQVVLPPTYDAQADREFGVILLLHGEGGNANSWASLVDLRQIASDYDRLVVSASCGPYSWYVDRMVDGQLVHGAETALTKGLFPKLGERYRVARSGHWVCGYSMGGYGALRLGLQRPDLFSGIGALSPMIFPSQWEDRWKLPRAMGLVEDRRPYDLQFTEELASLDRHAFSLLCGDTDIFIEENRYAHKALTEKGVRHQWLDVSGAHDGRFWMAYLPVQLKYLHEQLDQPQP